VDIDDEDVGDDMTGDDVAEDLVLDMDGDVAMDGVAKTKMNDLDVADGDEASPKMMQPAEDVEMTGSVFTKCDFAMGDVCDSYDICDICGDFDVETMAFEHGRGEDGEDELSFGAGFDFVIR